MADLDQMFARLDLLDTPDVSEEIERRVTAPSPAIPPPPNRRRVAAGLVAAAIVTAVGVLAWIVLSPVPDREHEPPSGDDGELAGRGNGVDPPGRSAHSAPRLRPRMGRWLLDRVGREPGRRRRAVLAGVADGPRRRLVAHDRLLTALATFVGSGRMDRIGAVDLGRSVGHRPDERSLGRWRGLRPGHRHLAIARSRSSHGPESPHVGLDWLPVADLGRGTESDQRERDGRGGL